MSNDLHCSWLVPRTRASSKRHAWGYFLEVWIRRGLSARLAQGSLLGTPRARSLLVYMSCKVEKLNVRTMCIGVQAGIDYGMLNLYPVTSFKGSELCPLSLSWCMHGSKSSGAGTAPLYVFFISPMLRGTQIPYLAAVDLSEGYEQKKESDDQLPKLDIRFQNWTTYTENRTTSFCVKEGNRDIRTPKMDEKEQNQSVLLYNSNTRSNPQNNE
ncbi:hypothetical protein M9H77_22753 [Catharanthus roseus]|uniref:Uncharacterized protein n=1 Tax=Catharanthus roseus TaxID=4058 RepID=A0ACC0ARB9_CATRO|nr:hypothetical protein M9H77_22753 [Catharanthus roseus]